MLSTKTAFTALRGRGAALAALLTIGALACSGPDAPTEQTEALPAPVAEGSVPTLAPGPKPLWQQHIEELQPEVEAWARAWSNQDVDAYLAAYSPDFEPPNGLSRSAWEAQRRERLTRPARISVTLSGFVPSGFSKGWRNGRQMELVKVRFHQTYESDTFRDEVDKEMQLELVDLTWKIVTETSL